MQFQEIEQAYWKLHGYRDADIVRAFEESKPEDLFCLVEIFPDKRLEAHWKGELHHNCALTLKMLEAYCFIPLSKPVKFLFCYHDGFYRSMVSPLLRSVPVLAYAKELDDFQTILIPDPLFELNNGYDSMRWYVGYPFGFDKESTIPLLRKWETRTPILFWRGSSTGNLIAESNPYFNIRIGATAALYRAPSCDLAITRLVNCLSNKAKIEVFGIVPVADPVPQDAFFQYRYLLDLPGNACAWSYFWKLLCGSCVVHVPGNTKQWFYDYLKPWIHYIPATVNSLKELMPWILAHDEDCRQMMLAAHAELALHSYTEVARAFNRLFAQLITTRIADDA